jgi:hypothetical protein
MAIYAVGANYHWGDVSQDFIDNGIVATGWDGSTAPDIHEMFRDINVGDIVYIKSCNFSSNITVKAIGIVRDDFILSSLDEPDLIEIGRNIRWIYTDCFVITRPANQKNNVRGNTIYREYHPEIISTIMSIVNKTI